MIASAFQLGVVLTLVDHASSGLKKIQGAVHSMKNDFEGLGKSAEHLEKAGRYAKTFAFAGVSLRPLVQEASKFESSLSGLKAVSNATTRKTEEKNLSYSCLM